MLAKTSAVNRQWRLAARPQGLVKESDFRWVEEPVPALEDGQILVRTLYLSLDPTNRVWMNDMDTYMPKLPLGAVMRGGALGVVEESRNPQFAPGDLVQGLTGWQDFYAGPPLGFAKLARLPGLPLTAYFGAMGHIGFTAYFGLLDVCKPKEGETLIVTGAAGAVGSIAGQIGKLKGCRVIGVAGSDEKCAWIKDELGFDAAINYKTENVAEALRRHCPNGIDVGFENVGGPVFELILMNLNLHARIALCGMISQYTAEAPAGIRSISFLIMKRALIQGFLVSDYAPRFGEAAAEIVGWLKQGKLKYRVDLVEGLEKAPVALNRLFEGSNTGKLIVKVSEEPA